MTSDKDSPQLNCCAWFKYCKLAQISRAYFAVRRKFNISDVIKKRNKILSTILPPLHLHNAAVAITDYRKSMCQRLKLKWKTKRCARGLIWQYVQLRTRLTVDGASLHQHQHQQAPEPNPTELQCLSVQLSRNAAKSPRPLLQSQTVAPSYETNYGSQQRCM